MGIFNWFDSGKTVVKTVKGKYTGKPLDVTVDDIRKKYIIDEQGHKNEIALFLRENSTDRKAKRKLLRMHNGLAFNITKLWDRYSV